MAFDTVRTNKLRSGLTVLGVVIGITSIVAMTSLIRGFDSLTAGEHSDRPWAPDTIFIQRFGITSFASGREFSELIKRPEPDGLRCARARSEHEHASIRRHRDRHRARTAGDAADLVPRHQRRGPCSCSGQRNFSPKARGIRHAWPAVSSAARRSSTAARSPCLATARTSCCSETRGSIRSARPSASAANQFVVVGVFDKAPVARQFHRQPGRFRRHSLHDLPARVRRSASCRTSRGMMPTAVQISVVPRERRHTGDGDRGNRAHHAEPARLRARRAERFRHRHAGRADAGLEPDQSGDVLRAGRHLVDCADGRRHRRDGDHVDLGDRAHARDRRAARARRAPPRSALSVPDGSRRADVGRRSARVSFSEAPSGWPCISSPDSPSRFRCGPSRWESASPPLSVSSSACIRRSAPRDSIRSKRCGTSKRRTQQSDCTLQLAKRLARRAGRINVEHGGEEVWC